jgi:membrane associated rhomboid family serine protease
MRPGGAPTMAGGFPRPGKAITILIAINVVAYVLELVLLRAGFTFVADLFLIPAAVFERGHVWQPFTYVFLHAPEQPFHLIWNMLWLWMFGAPLERWWGAKRLVTAYAVCALSGAAFTLAVALLIETPVLGWLSSGFWTRPHVGASGAVMGLTIAWGIVFANEEMNMLFLGRMKGKTFVLIIVAIELLIALSFDSTSSTSHFGGMIGAFVLCKGLWRPSRWGDSFRRWKLKRDRRRIERELRILEGGKKDPKKDLPN